MKRLLLTAGLMFVAAFASAQTQTEVVYSNDFQSLGTQGNPPGWVDNPIGEPRREADGLYKTWPDPLQPSNVVYGTRQASGQPDGNTPRIGTFSTLTTHLFSTTGRFEYRGRMIRTTADARIGLTFLSSYTLEDRYYLVGLWSRPSGGLSMQLFGFGAGTPAGTLDSNFTPDPNVWYRFLVQVDDAAGETRIRVRFWPDGTTEPDTFAINAVDGASGRLREGRIGLWAAVRGDAYIDDIFAKSPVDHTPPAITLFESGNPLPDGSKFNRDAVPEIRVTDDLSAFTYAATLDGAPFPSLTPVTAEGWHTLSVRAVDDPGNITEVQIRFLVDKTAPAIVIREGTAPFPPGFSFNRDVVATAAVSDVSETTVTATLDGVLYGLGTPITAEGSHSLSVTAVDEVGWSTTAGPVAFVIDKTPPALTFTSHSNGDVLTEAHAVIAGRSDDAVSVVVGGSNATLDLEARVFTSVSLPLLEGENSIVASGRDRAGNIGTATLRLIVDTRAPALSISAPAADACIDAGALQVNGVADDSRLQAVTVTAGSSAPVQATVDAATGAWTATVPIAAEGRTLVTVAATDSAGHSASVSRSVVIDRTAPVIEVRESGASFTATAVNRSVAFFIRADDADANAVVSATLDGAPYVPGTPVAGEGPHTLAVSATDCAGHTAQKSVQFTIDLTAPAIGDLSPANGGTVGTMPTSVSGRTDADVVSVELTDPPLQAQPGADGAFTIASVPFAEGLNRFTLTARDRAGNSSSTGYAVKVKTNAPAVEIRESGSPIADDALFNRALTPVIRSSDPGATIVATLNGAPYTSGTTIGNDGQYTLRATATDAFSHSSTEQVTFTIDRTPPVVRILSPASGPASSDLVDVRGSAGDAVSAALNGQPLVLAADGTFLVEGIALNLGPNVLVATGRDRAGNVGRDEVVLTRDELGTGIILTYPPDLSRTNRPTTDVVGRVLTPGRTSVVTIGATAVPIDSTGAFRLSGYALVEGENAITATATAENGLQSSAETRVTADFTPPALTILESGQPLSDGARFAAQAVISLAASDAGGGAVATALTVDGAPVAAPPFTVTAAGGHAVVATATDLAGNQSRAERTLFIGASGGAAGCTLDSFDPPDGAVVLANKTELVGRSGAAAGVKVNGVPALVADGAFCASVELPVEGANTVTLVCTDANGNPTGTPVTITLQRVTGAPSISISSPEEGFASAQESIAVSGTVGPGVITADVNGVPATISGSDSNTSRPFTVAAVRLTEGLNLLVAHGRNAGGRTGTASRRGIYLKDGPSIQINAPATNTTTGIPQITVSGTYANLDPASLVLENLSSGAQAPVQFVRTSDRAGRFTVGGVALASGEQTLRVSGRDRLNRPATASVVVRLAAGTPGILISEPADHSSFGGGSDSVTVRGTFQAAEGAAVDVNGVAATISGTTYTASVKFSTLAGGITPIVARVTEPAGGSASAIVTVTQLADAPSVIESFPAANAAEVDSGALLLVLFSQPMDVATLSAAFRLEDASGAPVTGSLFLDRDVLTFAPATLLTPGLRYTLRVTTAAKNLAGTALPSDYSSSFTTITSAPTTPPTVTPLGSAVCGQSITVAGTAPAGARLRLESGVLILNTSADASGHYTFSWPLSGQSGYAVVRVRVVGSDGSLSPAAELKVRIDCAGPQVLNAGYDRATNQLTIELSERIDPASATAGSGNAIVLTLEDGRIVGGTASVNQKTVTVTPAEDLTAKAFSLTVTTAIRDIIGNALVTPYSQAFALGSDQPVAGDGSGFISGEVYDATTGRPLAGAAIAIDVGSAASITTNSDARGRYLARLPEGAHTIRASRDGYTTVWREILVPAGAGVIPIDMRLTRRGPPSTSDGSAIASSHGGDTAVTKKVDLSLPAGSLTSGATIALTSMGGQALTGLLPLGWSPVAAAEIIVNGSDTAVPLPGAQLAFHVPAAEITAASQNLAAVQYDAARDEWRVVVSVVSVGSDGRAAVPVASSGAYALVYPDKAAGLTAPPLPAAGDVLRGVPAAPVDAPALVKRDFQLDPPIVLPDGRAVATLRTEGAGAGATYPSGTAVQAYIDEELRLADGSRLLDPPFATDLLLYRTLAGDLGVADFHLAPSARAAEVVLETGVDRIRVLPYPGRLDRGTLIGTEGGPVPADDKVSIEIPSGAVPEPLRATAASLTASDLQAIGAIAGFRVVGGFQLTLQRATEPPSVDLDGDGTLDPAGAPELFVPARATVRIEASQLPAPGAQVILAELLDQTPFGRMVRLTVPMMPVDPSQTGTPVVRFTTRSIDRSVLAVDGVVREGRYVVLAAEGPIAFATGTIRSGDATGRLLSEARIMAPPLGVADLSRGAGIYNLPVPARPAAPFTLVPRHATTGDGAPYVHATAPDADAVVRVDLVLVPQPPTLGQVVVLRGNPPAQAALSAGSVTRDVAVTTNVRASFTPSIDPASVTADSITVTDAVTGARVNGSAAADGSVAVVWTLVAGQLLRPNGRYVVAVSPTIRGTNGAALGRGATFTFETVTEILNNEIRRERIRITIPDAIGVSRIIGEPGALPAGWQAVAVRRGRDFNVRYQATAAGDGSFSFPVGNGGDPADRVSIGDRIDLQVISNIGNLAAIFALTPFVSEDGKSFVVPAGSALRYTTPDGITIDVPAGAFDQPTVLAVQAAIKNDFLEIPSFEDENEYAASVRIDFEGEAKKHIDVEVAVPAGYDTAGKEFILAWKGMSVRGPRLAVADIMRVANGKFTTVQDEAAANAAITVQKLGTGAQQTLTGRQFRDYLIGMRRAGYYTILDIKQPVGGAVGWGVMEGIQANYDLMWSIFFSYYEPYIHVFERTSRIIPVLTDTPFTVFGIDRSTGLQAFSRAYDPIPAGPPFTAQPIPSPQQNDSGPYPTFATPFRVEILDLDVENLDIESIRNFIVKVDENGTVKVRSGPEGLDPQTKVELINASGGTFVAGTAGAELSTEGLVGDRIALLVEQREVDPLIPVSIAFNEPIFTGGSSDPDFVDGFLHSLVKVEQAPEPGEGDEPDFTDITPLVRLTTDSGNRRINVELPSAPQRGAVYRVTLDAGISDIVQGGGPGLTLGQGTEDVDGVLTPIGGGEDFHLIFRIRKPAGELNSFTAAPTGTIRGAELYGNVLVVAALDGGLRAYDVSNPAAAGLGDLLGYHPGPPENAVEHLSVTIDRHGRVITTAHQPIAGILRSYRIEDLIAGQTPPKIYASTIINWKMGYSSMIGLPSNTVLSDRPESIPYRIKVVLQDDEKTFENLEAFMGGTGAQIARDYPNEDLNRLSLTVGHSGGEYKYERITVENVSLDMRWSRDASPSGAASFGDILARSTDKLRLVRNLRTYAVVAHLGFGVGAYDLNAAESNRHPLTTQESKIREQLFVRNGILDRSCSELPSGAIRESYLNLDAEIRGDQSGNVLVYGLDVNRGILDYSIHPGGGTGPCDERSPTGLVLRSFPPGGEVDPIPALVGAISAAGGTTNARFQAAAQFGWAVTAEENRLGLRGTTANEPARRDYILVAGFDYGLLVVEVDSSSGDTGPYYPLDSRHIADVIWIPGGASGVRVVQSANIAVVNDKFGRVVLVDISRIDERWMARIGGLFPTAAKALQGTSTGLGVGADDPRIIWTSEPGVTSGALAPVFDPETGMIYGFHMTQRKVKVLSAVDPTVRFKVNLGDKTGLSDVGGIVPLGVSPPDEIKQRIAALPGCAGEEMPCKENASLGAFRLEMSLPGRILESLTMSNLELRLAIESERISGAVTEQTPDGFPKAHLRRTRRNGQAETSGRAVTFRLKRIVPDELAGALRYQRGFNRFISPWVVALADPRASEEYEWQEASSLQEKEEAGCYACERPEHLKGLTESDGVYELWTNGRFISVRPELIGADDTIFNGTIYSYLGQLNRVAARISTIIADTVRPTEVLAAGQNPPAEAGLIQETVLLHSGELESGTLDLVAGSRAESGVAIDRTYRSRTIANSPFGAGWDSSLFRRVRALPNGEVEYRDGAELWVFKPDLGTGGYQSPKGYFFKLARTARGWKLIDQQWRIIEFDDFGRILSESDEFFDPQLPDSGNIVRYVYDATGRLSQVVDPVQRVSKVEYWPESGGGTGAYPGLVRRISDWRDRFIDYEYDPGAGTLVKARLPEVANTSGGRPTIEYSYAQTGGSYTDKLELRTNLVGIKDPHEVAAGGPPRLTLTYAAGGGFRRDRVIDQQWGTGESASFTYDSRTSASTTDALGQSRNYSLSEQPKNRFDDRAHVLSMVENGVQTGSTAFGELPAAATPGAPPTSSANRTFNFSHNGDGLLTNATLNGVRSTTFSYVDVRPEAAGFVLAGTNTTALGGSAPALNQGISYQSGANLATFISGVTANGQKMEAPEPSRNARTLSTNNDQISVTERVDTAGLPTALTGSGGTDSSSAGASANVTYAPADGPEHKRSLPTSVDDGGLAIQIDYPSRDKMVETHPGGIVRTVDYDSWERPIHINVTAPQVTIDERYEYDATGRLRRYIRKQGPTDVTTSFEYDALGRLTSTTIDNVAGGGTAATGTSYQLAGRRIVTNNPGGSVTTISVDGLGRTASRETTTGGSPIVDQYAYDLDGNTVFVTDLQSAVAYAWDAHGRLVGMLDADGVRTTATLDGFGLPTEIRRVDASGASLGTTTFDFTDGGKLRAASAQVDASQSRSTNYAWDGAGRTTGQSASGRAMRSTYDAAGRVLSSASGGGSALDVSAPFSSVTVSSHAGRLPQAATRTERSGSALSMAMEFNVLGEAMTERVGSLEWNRTFDQSGNLTSARAPGRGTSNFEYDSRGALKRQTLPGGAENAYAYHGTGAIAGYTDPSGEATQTTNDLVGRPIRRVYKDGTEETIEWEGRRVRSVTDRKGRTRTFSYNAKGQINEVRSGGTVLQSIEYDGAGRVTRLTTPDSVVEYEDFDFEGHPRKTTQKRLSNGSVVDSYSQQHSYTVHGERSSWTMPTYGGFSSPNPWTVSVSQEHDEVGNVVRMQRTMTGSGGGTLLEADYRNAGRPERRTLTTGSGQQIVRQYGYDGATGLPNRMEVTAGGVLVGGSVVTYNGLQKVSAQLLGLSGGLRATSWGYDAQGRLAGSALARNADATPDGEAVTNADFRTALNRAPATPADPPAVTFTEDSRGGHKIASVQRGSTVEQFAFEGGERVADGRFLYEYDAEGRLSVATEKVPPGSTLSVSRVKYVHDGNDRVIGRRAEYAQVTTPGTQPQASAWVLEDRPNVLQASGLPAEATFVWDPISDRLVSIFKSGASQNPSIDANGGLVRQILHGDLRFDDPLEVAAATDAGVVRLYPVYDEIGSSSLQVITNAEGKVLSRSAPGGPYGEDESVLRGAAVDRVTIKARKEADGGIAAVEVSIRATEDFAPASLAAGLRIAAVTSTGQVVRVSSKVAELAGGATALWTFTEEEWNALVDVTPVVVEGTELTAAALSVAVTSQARAQAWSATQPFLPAPSWAVQTKPVFASAALPVDVRESLANLSQWLASIPADDDEVRVLYDIPTLTALGSRRTFGLPTAATTADPQVLIVASAFHAHPFQDPLTGKNYVRARWFDPQTGTWLTPDPRGYQDSPNLYAYAAADPVNLTDPSGEAIPLIAIAVYLGWTAVNTSVDVGVDYLFHAWLAPEGEAFDWKRSIVSNGAVNLLTGGLGKLKHLRKLEHFKYADNVITKLENLRHIEKLNNPLVKGAGHAALSASVNMVVYGESATQAFASAIAGKAAGELLSKATRAVIKRIPRKRTVRTQANKAKPPVWDVKSERWRDPTTGRFVNRPPGARRVVVIGENMTRVKNHAAQIGAETWKAWPIDPWDQALSNRRDQRWIQDKMKQGYDIVDIGPDFERRLERTLRPGPMPAISPNYMVERTEIAWRKYAKYTRVYERWGRFSGGVPGFDF